MSNIRQTKKLDKYERYFFDIPVFRCEKEKWNQERKDEVMKLAQNIAGNGKKITERELVSAEKWLRSDFSFYRYGEMIGMIRLFAMNQQIRGELFFVDQRITKDLKNKRWKYFGKLFEFMIFDIYTNQIIFNKILKRLQKENREQLLKNRFIDLEAFCNSGEYIDYIKLVDFDKKS